MKAKLVTGEEIWYPGKQESLLPELHWFVLGIDSWTCSVCGRPFDDGYHHTNDYVDNNNET